MFKLAKWLPGTESSFDKERAGWSLRIKSVGAVCVCVCVRVCETTNIASGYTS